MISLDKQCDWLFSSLDEDVNVLANGEKDSGTNPVTSMDQQLLEKAEHLGNKSFVFLSSVSACFSFISFKDQSFCV